ncbi:MAG TPA: hypothetical protein VES88_12080 [Gemmatimonadaceae bacterium]|nr:hypothetical protein [Gemmatimonadaceae bacterium]
MTLQSWLANRWLVEHETSAEEIADLLSVVDRDLIDAKVAGVSSDWRLAMAYNAALQLATLALAAEGFRPDRLRAHERAIQSLRYTVGADRDVIDVLDAVRRKRNVSNYERAGSATEGEVREVYEIATTLRHRVRAWLAERHPELIG